MKGGLTGRLLLCIALPLLAFVLLTGGLFGWLFLGYTESHHKKDLHRLARTLAEGLPARPEASLLLGAAEAEPTAQAAGDHHGRGMHGMGRRMGRDGAGRDRDVATDRGTRHGAYCRRTFGTAKTDAAEETDADRAALFAGRYLRELNALSESEVWIVDAKTRAFSLYGEDAGLRYEELPPAAESLLRSVFAGETAESEDFSPLLSAPSVTVGAPIRDAGGAVTGALLLHRTLDNLRETQKDALRLLGLCLAGALLVAALLSALLARRFVGPLKRMEAFAGRLAAGDYESRSGIRQDDEIGSLAESLDTLAERLGDARRQKERLDKMRQDFLAAVSHELKTPVTVMRGLLELLSSGLVTDEGKRRDYLGQMTENVLGLQRLIRDLFELTRLQNADFAIEKSPLDLREPLGDACRAARSLAPEKGVRWELRQTAEPLPVLGDYGRLRQMFLTVLDNAVKFSPAGGAVELETTVGDGAWRIVVRDRGCGIPAGELPHIFERFRTRHGERNEGGTGLGLPIAREIARRHDISLTCESVEGEGTAFIFTGRCEEAPK